LDNNDVDGYRKIILSGSVYISSCDCGTSAENGGIVTANLVIADNDGPSLSVSVDPISLPEGNKMQEHLPSRAILQPIRL